MNRFRILTVLLTVLLFTSCDNTLKNVPEKYHAILNSAFEKAGENAKELKSALNQVPAEQKEGMAFLISYMPKRDLTSLKADFLIENSTLAYVAREKYSWCKQLPDSIFFNEVLPYVSFNETREKWRADFVKRFAPYVEKCTNIRQAIDSINKNIKTIVEVEYNTKREKPDQSPFESMRQNMASCTGLSILLTDAFRAVGIPSRIAGTPLWTNMRGNHNWCEVWVDGTWYFTEYYPDKLDHSWFLGDAGKADPKKPLHWIYASSWKSTGISFPLVWDEDIKYVPAENVTDRYIRIYQEQLTDNGLAADEMIANVILFKNDQCTQDGNQRVAAQVRVMNKKGKKISWGYTPSATDDMNKFLKFKLKKNTKYTFVFPAEGGLDKKLVVKTGNAAEEMIKLYQK